MARRSFLCEVKVSLHYSLHERSFVHARALCESAKLDKAYIEAPALPTDAPLPPKSEKENMEDFLDDLLG